MFLLFISAFRYDIGYDYNSYKSLFLSDLESMNIETSFKFVVKILDYLSFSYQAMLAVYALFTIIIFYFGFKYYNKDNTFFLALYALVPMFYWNNQSIIRQALAVAIVFWASRYLIQGKNAKAMGMFLIAAFFYISAIVFLPFIYLIKLINKPIRLFSIIVISVAVGVSGLTPILVEKIFEGFLNDSKYLIYLQYIPADTEKASMMKIAIQLSIWFFIFCSLKNRMNNNKIRVILSVYTLGVAIYFLSYDLIWLGRVKLFFDYFLIIALWESFSLKFQSGIQLFLYSNRISWISGIVFFNTTWIR